MCCCKELSHPKYNLCPSCSHLGGNSNSKYSSSVSLDESPIHSTYRAVVHAATYDPRVDTETMMKYLLKTYMIDELKGKMLIRRDTDEVLSPTNYRLEEGRLRGLAKKQSKPSLSQYIGVSSKTSKSGIIRYSASLKGKYILGSSSLDENISAAVRDNYIISLDLQDSYRLNFS